MTPPQVQTSFEVSFKAGKLLTGFVGEPGAQGATVFGTHGIGVRTPAAAVVAEAVAGKAGQLHTPNGLMFTMGL